jgi:hypothetical protein
LRVALRPGFEGLLSVCHQAAIGAAENLKRRLHMTDTNTQPTSKAPSHVAYQVRERKGGNSFWTRIGSAWPHADGKGFNIQIETVPLDGRITLRVATEKKN